MLMLGPSMEGAFTPKSGPFSPPITPNPKSIPRTIPAKPSNPHSAQQQGLQHDFLVYLLMSSATVRSYYRYLGAL